MLTDGDVAKTVRSQADRQRPEPLRCCHPRCAVEGPQWVEVPVHRLGLQPLEGHRTLFKDDRQLHESSGPLV
jgi:hypothetical protein